MAAKMTCTTVGVLFIAVVWLFATFQTSVGSELKWAQHNQAIACRTVYEYEIQIMSFRQTLKLDKHLSTADREWINDEIIRLNTLIGRIDPNGEC